MKKQIFISIFSPIGEFSRERSSNYWELLSTRIYRIESLKLENRGVK